VPTYSVNFYSALDTSYTAPPQDPDDPFEMPEEVYLDDGDFLVRGMNTYPGPIVFNEVVANGSFEPGETLTATDGFSYTFISTAADGFIAERSDGPSYYFSQVSTVSAGTIISSTSSPLAVCFYAGTLIATPTGDRAVEALVPGDLVMASDGTARPLKWMWRQSMVTAFADPLRSLPVIVRAGSLADGLPVRDLIVSPDHALLIDGLLVHADALVNGSSVVRMQDLPERFTYFHIELADHALVMAEGVAAETFVDNVTRRRFDNWAEYEATFGDAPAIDELDLPRVKSARQLPSALRVRLADLADRMVPRARAA